MKLNSITEPKEAWEICCQAASLDATGFKARNAAVGAVRHPFEQKRLTLDFKPYA
ncbi:hypothetical protein [uncultured Sphingomonas sp.]|uniref:hypothetical protein n=1 Tax=uncultured Sphingomonas sp. TaxID=158754 RepID=UPI0035C9D881